MGSGLLEVNSNIIEVTLKLLILCKKFNLEILLKIIENVSLQFSRKNEKV